MASLIVLVTGVIWGFYWAPVRLLEQAGFEVAWGTVAITGAGVLTLAPFMLRYRVAFARADRLGILAIALGGAGFALYSIALIYGRVAIVVLLFFLTPVWSTLIARFVLGWRTPALRLVAILLGLAGLAVMLSASGDWPIPRQLGEWLGLISGIVWAIGSTGIKLRGDLPPLPAAFVFVCGGAAISCALVPFLAGGADPSLWGGVVAIGTGALWWGAAMAGLMWATRQLDPARVGILLMSEVLVAAVSAAVFAGEELAPVELIGGAMVVMAALFEVLPQRRGKTSGGQPRG
ncbi:DMT family transporter [Sulfitobacter sp. HNIBRBA3233]|uniref:DMT family transporter n=1 Tax=Sulfitobacter marinivivus TaxID=3158558 RepID=UPI0032DF3114